MTSLAAIVVTGSSGLVGRAFASSLNGSAQPMIAFRRSMFGQPEGMAALEGSAAIVHLAGASLVERRWTPSRKAELVSSRVDLTTQLVSMLSSLKVKPRVLVCASAVGIYGDCGDVVLTEQSAPGIASDRGAEFLADLCVKWEQAAMRAEALGIRVVCARFGAILSKQGGALAKMLLPFQMGLGGPLGSGRQWMSWIHIDDAVAALRFAIAREELNGAVNVVAPSAVSQHGFATALGRSLSRPAFMPTPAFALRAIFGELAPATLLASQNVRPEALSSLGFTWKFQRLGDALGDLVSSSVTR